MDEPSASGGRQCVILLHGLARTSRSLDRMEEALAEAGYHTVNLDYPSRSQPVERLAAAYVAEGFRRCAASGARPVHFVTHSMGGILVRYYLG